MFIISNTSNGGYYWYLKARNGQTLCTSEVYTTRQHAEYGVEAAKRVMPYRQYYEILNARGGGYYWHVKASNHQILAASEVYTSHSAAEGGIASAIKTATEALLPA